MAVYTLIKGSTTVQTVANVGRPNIIAETVSASGPNYPATNHAFQVVVTGPVTATATVQFVGSNDGVNWDNYGATVAATVTVADGSPGTKTQAGTTAFKFIGAFITAASNSPTNVVATVSA